MPAAIQTDLLNERTILMPVTVDQYHQMIDAEIVPEGEPYELLSGHVVLTCQSDKLSCLPSRLQALENMLKEKFYLPIIRSN